MATTKSTLEKLLNKEEILYWAKKNSIEIEEFSGGYYVGEWQINLDINGNITSVERMMDEPQQL